MDRIGEQEPNCDPSRHRRDAPFSPDESELLSYLASLPEPTDSPAPESTLGELLDEAESAGGSDRIAAEARRLDPGPVTAQMLAVIHPARLGSAGLLDAACAAERLASWTQAVQHRYVAAFARPGVAAPVEQLVDYASSPGQPLHRTEGRGRTDVDSDSDLAWSVSVTHGRPQQEKSVLAASAVKVAAAELSAALLVSPINAGRRVAQAVDFTDDLPATLRALRDGAIDRGRAMVIADRTQNLPTDLRRRVEARIVPKATGRTAGQIRGIADRAVIAADPAAARKRQETARARRGISIRPGEDGMSVFRADLAADKSVTAFSVIDQIATANARNSSEKRPIGAIRADVFADIFDQLASHGSVHLLVPSAASAPCPHRSSAASPIRVNPAESGSDPAPTTPAGGTPPPSQTNTPSEPVTAMRANASSSPSGPATPSRPAAGTPAGGGAPSPCETGTPLGSATGTPASATPSPNETGTAPTSADGSSSTGDAAMRAASTTTPTARANLSPAPTVSPAGCSRDADQGGDTTAVIADPEPGRNPGDLALAVRRLQTRPPDSSTTDFAPEQLSAEHLPAPGRTTATATAGSGSGSGSGSGRYRYRYRYRYYRPSQHRYRWHQHRCCSAVRLSPSQDRLDHRLLGAGYTPGAHHRALRHHRSHHSRRARRSTGRTRWARPDPRGHGPGTCRQRRDHHRYRRQPRLRHRSRPRPHDLPTQTRPTRQSRPTRPHLPLRGLQTARLALPDRSFRRVLPRSVRRWGDLPLQPGLCLQVPPRPENLQPLGHHPPPRRLHHLDRPHQPPIHQPTPRVAGGHGR